CRGQKALRRAPPADALFPDRSGAPGAPRLCRPPRNLTAAGGRPIKGQTAMRQAVSQLVSDFLSALFFLFVYLATGNIIAAAAIAIAAAGHSARLCQIQR